MKLLLTFVFLTLTSFTFAQTESKCFRSDTLHGGSTVNFKTNGQQLSGIYSIEKSDDGTPRTHEFGGTRKGRFLSVIFDETVDLDVAPSYFKTVIWTLVKTAEKEILRINIYGKNYVTNEYKDYFADFHSCEPRYATLLKMAKNIRLYTKHPPEKGLAPHLSFGERISFEDATQRKVFLMSVFKARTFNVDAAGCTISVYLPDGKLYEFVEWESGSEKTFASSTIDRLTIESTPQTGNYMVVLKKMAEDARPEMVRFKSY